MAHPNPPRIPSYFIRLPRELQREILYKLSDEDLLRLVQGLPWTQNDILLWSQRGLVYNPEDPRSRWVQYVRQIAPTILDNPYLLDYVVHYGGDLKLMYRQALRNENIAALARLCQLGILPKNPRSTFEVFAKHGYIPGLRCFEEHMDIPWEELLRLAIQQGDPRAVRSLLGYHRGYRPTFVELILRGYDNMRGVLADYMSGNL